MKPFRLFFHFFCLLSAGSLAAASSEIDDGRSYVVRADTNGPVKVLSILPQAGAVETKVMLTGQGFAAENTIHFGSGVIINVPVASAIGIGCTRNPRCIPGILQTLVFTVPSVLIPPCYYMRPRCLERVQRTEPGDFVVTVENSNGASNPVVFKVTRF